MGSRSLEDLKLALYDLKAWLATGPKDVVELKRVLNEAIQVNIELIWILEEGEE